MQRSRPRRASSSSETDEPLFPPRQAFVVHFRSGSDAADPRCAGRVEHVVSGRSARFRRTADLLAFMRRVLREIGQTARTTPRDRDREETPK